ncbi:alpha-N-arabinofuranosidase [Saccharothrix ecbatanensis]|uniref:non-reducing end alpha-L-arabinofuranosidase n=1 Tax=Saccharothrix ecbatanensis TaxID=1105145 RepID=A0A7W9HK25_9PSEU|nr:alpha-L-arabinofuranosidase C-terminal domain-containing protein [Saccharothrix ecbatanensis]MBB5803555.1 alpha-N-arabinofuranosidase [Saccharothrix ecbatanensis]
MTEATVRAVVNLDVEGPVINRHVYGHFAEHLGRCIYGGFYVGEDSDVPNVGGIRLDVVEALRALGIPNLRWPGGCFADEYHWRDGIGPKGDRPVMVNTHWGGVEENNHFGTHEFMALCELLGTEPYVSGNVGSGTVQEMSEWVEYVTRQGGSPAVRERRVNGREEPWTVRFWGLGNEAWGCGGNMSAAQYAFEARRFATYCRDYGDNKLYRIAAGAAEFDYAWTETLMKQLSHLGCQRVERPLYQALSVHYYTISGTWSDKGDATVFTEDEYYATMLQANRTDELLTGHGRVMDVYDPTKEIGLVLDEWGTWWNVEPGTNPGFLYQQNTMRDALVASLHFDIFHRHADRLVMANIAQTVNVLQAMILTDPDSGALVLTPTYHVFRMNKGHQDAASLRVDTPAGIPTREVDGKPLPTVSVSASRKNGRLLVSLSNLDAGAGRDVEIDLRGGTVGDIEATILTADTLQAHNTPEALEAVAPRAHEGVKFEGTTLRVHLPAHSFVTVAGALA